MPRTAGERLWKRVAFSEGCWHWQGAKNAKGYGFISVERRTVGVHRLAYELCVGPIPTGSHLDHLCRNRACCNPAHLEPVDNAENVARGIGPSAQNARKTFCAKGHPLTGENLSINYRGDRVCITCRRARAAARREREKGQEPSARAA